MFRKLILCLSVLAIAGCAATAQEGYLKTQEVAFKELDTITQPEGAPIIIAVYDFGDMSGQKKPGGAYASMSSAVTQGSYQILIKALQDAGEGKWFRVVERHSLASLLQERKLIRTTRQMSDGESAEALPALLFAGAYVTGGIVGYDSDVLSGGAGARVLGIGASKEYRQDIISIMLRLINVQTGEVIISTTIEKTIYSSSTGGDVFKYFDADTMLVEIEAGYAKNEPVTYAVRKAIEAGVVSLIKEGAELELWKFGPTQQEITAQEEEKLRLELEAEEALFIAEEEQIKLKEENKELEKELDELLKEESTDEKDNEDSADPVPNNIHG
jgi:curli production assembly/transport component CsgG|tara:strand:- start:202 stop:1188 length:987 start_codon:yes stop_codon:yes gene_type:complete